LRLIVVDETKCKQDGLCAADCPTAVLRLRGKNSYPKLVPTLSLLAVLSSPTRTCLNV